MTEYGKSKPSHRRSAKFILFTLTILAVMSLPFIFFGEEFTVRLLGNQESRSWAIAAVGVILLTADSLAPIPSAIVIVAVALKAGWVIGTIAGTIGLCGQVVGAAWFGRVAIGKLALRVFGLADVQQLRVAIEQRLSVTLGCVRSVPLLAEASVVLAASLGIPVRRIFSSTVLPNLAIAATYSIAAQAGLGVAGFAVVASAIISFGLWRTTMPAEASASCIAGSPKGSEKADNC